MSKKTVVLLILDGWGIGERNMTNPIHTADPPNINYIKSHYRGGALQASGISVGLPWDEEGNSEVGHVTIGAGRVIYQHFPRITMAIQNGEFFNNPALTDAAHHALHHHSTLHYVGLLSEGNVHASRAHLEALIELGTRMKAPAINLHLISDGKDGPPRSFLKTLRTLPLNNMVRLASVSGRYYAMDRDKHWDRTMATYTMLRGAGTLTADIQPYVEYYYKRNLNDDFFEPTLLGAEKHSINDNDAVIFFNFREDSIRQLAACFALPAEFLTKEGAPPLPLPLPKNLFVATMTHYAPFFTAKVAFAPHTTTNTLGEVLSANEKFQLRVAETEKYAHITYFFNGLKDAPLKNEYRILVPSRDIAHPDEHPEMMTHEIASRVIQSIEEGIDFVLANIASPDIVAHTGNFDAAVAAVRVVDQEVGNIAKAALARDAALMITSDHGNIEQMRDPYTGAPETRHNTNPVPLYLVGKEFERVKDPGLIAQSETETIGILADIAPTVLHLLAIPQPIEMKGENLTGRLL